LKGRAAKLADVCGKGFVVSVLLLSTGALLPLLRGEGGASVPPVPGGPSIAPPAEGNDPMMQVMWTLVYALSLLLVVRSKKYLHIATRDKLLLLLVGIAVVSVLWSAAPEVTLRRSAALVGTTLFGIYLAARYDLGELLRLLAWALGIAALLSLVFAIALPSYGTQADYRGLVWRGVYIHKNILGYNMVLSAVVFLLLALGDRRYRWVTWSGLGLSASLILLSNSITSMITLLALLTLLPLFWSLRWHYSLAVSLYTIAVLGSGILIFWLASNTESVLEAFGRDASLTGRTQLWEPVLEMIWQRPWLGYGYGGFWLGLEGKSALVWNVSGIYADHAHNGLLNVWLDLGLLGVSVFTLGFLLTLLRALAWARLTKTAEGLWPLAFLSFMLLHNVAETSLLLTNNVVWILYAAVVLLTVRKPRDRRGQVLK